MDLKPFFELGKRGREEINILEDPMHFSFFLHVYENQKEKNSYPLKICTQLFNCSNLVNIVKSNEYQRVLRFGKKLEAEELIKLVKDKSSRGQKTYYVIYWNGVLKNILKMLKELPVYSDSHDFLDGIKYKDNKYIIAFVKLYFWGLATSDTFKYKITPIDFKQSIILLFNRLMIFEPFNKKEFYEKVMEKYEGKDKEKAEFFKFLWLLKDIEEQYRPNSAVNGFVDYLANYIYFKTDRRLVYTSNKKEDIEHTKSWYGKLEDIEDHLEEIEKAGFYPD